MTRDALLSRVIEHLADNGSQDLTLRGIAAAVGTSHRMLIYHFSDLTGLLTAVVDRIEADQRHTLGRFADLSDGDLATLTREVWGSLRNERLQPFERLFFEMYGRTVAREGTNAGTRLVQPWLDAAEAVLLTRGVDGPRAAPLARLGLAVTRGLLLDLIATGDGDGVDAAMDLFVRQLETMTAAGGPATATPTAEPTS